MRTAAIRTLIAALIVAARALARSATAVHAAGIRQLEPLFERVGALAAVYPPAAPIAEWLGSIAGVAGATVLAVNLPWSGYGWTAFLLSNVGWLLWGLMTRRASVVVMQLAFTTTSLVGIYRWLVA